MKTYALRCLQTDYPELIQLGKALGVIQELDGQILPVGVGCWDYIGVKYDPESGTEVMIEGYPCRINQTPVGVGGVPYIHVNFRTEHDIRQKAEALAAANSSIAAGLANIGKYFITDAEGNATWPTEPIRTFA